MIPFAVAGLQTEVHKNRDNLSHIRAELEDLVETFPWVQMVVFSELAASGMCHSHTHSVHGELANAFRDMAKEHGIWLIPGSMYEQVGPHIYNTSLVIDPDGELIGTYRKQFPFTPYEQGVTPGTEPFVWDISGVGRFGLSICYDLWFPETVRSLVAQGVEVVLHPSLTDTVDREIELSIIKAMAAVNQCFVLDVNGLQDGGVGRSLFAGPSGEVLHQAGNSAEIIALEIDLMRVRRSREVGLRGLGQPLKSFRDRSAPFPIYAPGFRSAYLDSLGPLEKPHRGSTAGLESREPGAS